MARRNQAADQAAKRAALQNNDLIGVATLVPQTNLPETPSYTEGETLKAKRRVFKKIIWGGSKRRESFFCLGTSSGSWFTPYKPTTHLGEKALQRLLERSLRGTCLQTTLRQVVSSCPTCQLNNPQGAQRTQLAQLIQWCGTY